MAWKSCKYIKVLNYIIVHISLCKNDTCWKPLRINMQEVLGGKVLPLPWFYLKVHPYWILKTRVTNPTFVTSTRVLLSSTYIQRGILTSKGVWSMYHTFLRFTLPFGCARWWRLWLSLLQMLYKLYNKRAA